VKLKALRNYLRSSKSFLEGLQHWLREMYVDFNVAFHIVLMSNFTDVFLARTVGAQRGEYSTEEPNLDI